MTNKEALITNIGMPVDSLRIEKALVDFGIDGAAPYQKDDVLLISIQRATADILMSLKGVETVKEGDFSITISQAAVNQRLGLLAKQANIPELKELLQTPKPTVKYRNVW